MPLIHFTEKPSKYAGITWFLFAGTATFSAFFLPIFIYMELSPKYMPLPNIPFLIFLSLIVFTALYHSFYRIKTILTDLGLGAYEKIIVIFLSTLFGVLMGMTAYTSLVYLAFTVGM